MPLQQPIIVPVHPAYQEAIQQINLGQHFRPFDVTRQFSEQGHNGETMGREQEGPFAFELLETEDVPDDTLASRVGEQALGQPVPGTRRQLSCFSSDDFHQKSTHNPIHILRIATFKVVAKSAKVLGPHPIHRIPDYSKPVRFTCQFLNLMMGQITPWMMM